MNNVTTALGLTACALAVSLCLPFSSHASDEAFKPLLMPSLNLRVRLETAEQDNALEDATAFTVRHRIGIKTRDWHGLQLLAETEGVHALAGEDYNSGPGGNRRSNYSVIADPTDNELNQFWLNWTASENVQAKLGRQRLVYGNSRFLGNVGWRQNEQTYDALSLKAGLSDSLSLHYAYLAQVNRIFFDQRELQGHALQMNWDLAKAFKPTVFAYLLDFDSGADSQTLGLGLNGKWSVSAVGLAYALAYAKQQDYADAAPLDADYIHAELSAAAQGWRVAVGLEQLGGDGQQSFSTPLATLHKFNGWADVFLATPASGLVDQYVQLGYAQGAWSTQLMYHRFESDQGSADYGSEVDALLVWKYTKAHVAKLKFADYSSDGYAVDTQRMTLEWNYQFAG